MWDRWRAATRRPDVGPLTPNPSPAAEYRGGEGGKKERPRSPHHGDPNTVASLQPRHGSTVLATLSRQHDSAATRHEGLPQHESRSLGEEKVDDISDLGSLAYPFHRRLLDDSIYRRLVNVVDNVGFHQSGRDRIHANVERYQRLGGTLGKGNDSRFARGVGDSIRPRPKGGNRGHVDDPPEPPLRPFDL